MNLSSQFTKLVEQHEGFSPKAYKDARGLQTIGFGTLIDSAQLDYLLNATIDKNEAEQLLFAHAAKEKFILNNLLAQGWKLNQNQFDALADFAYNEGDNALLGSTLLKLIKEDPTNLEAIKNAFLAYDKTAAINADGTVKRNPDGSIMLRVLPGLVTRREDEYNLFITPVSNDTQA